MARMPGATWKPITGNHTKGGQVEVRGVVVHIMAGTLAGTDSWFRNPDAEASSHFGTGKQGALTQWVDTKDRAWAQSDGNRTWISVENEGKGGDELTDAQLDRNAEVLAWAHREHGVPLQVATTPGGRGLGHHGMGGRAWGNHPNCPGARIVAQKAEIVRRARLFVAPPKATPKPKPKPPVVKVVFKNGVPAWPGRVLELADPPMRGDDVKVWQQKLKARGWDITVNSAYGGQSKAVCEAWQRATGLPPTGRVDRRTWESVWSWRPPTPGLIDTTN